MIVLFVAVVVAAPVLLIWALLHIVCGVFGLIYKGLKWLEEGVLVLLGKYFAWAKRLCKRG
jgi:hypothetical protein